jgi:hypothetical protein
MDRIRGWDAIARHVVAFALTIGVNILYILAVDKLGFIPLGVIYLSRCSGCTASA